MKKFVEIEYWDYMDLKPNTEVRVFEGSDEKDLEKNVNDFVAHMKSHWCSGTTKLIGIMDSGKATAHIRLQVEKEYNNWQEDSKEFLDKIVGLYNDCYGLTFDYEEYMHQLDIADDYASREC